MTLDATVIIPTYKDWHVLQHCLDALADQSLAQGRFEIIVANNNPTTDVPTSLRLPPNARVIHVEKPGSYAARNAALREAQADALFFTDSDCRPDRLWIENGLAQLAGLRPIDRIAGGIELFSRADDWNRMELYDLIFSLRQDEYAAKGWCATANLVTRRAAFDLVGPFDENHFSGGDKDWGIRATEMGSLNHFSEEVLVRHPARDNFEELAKKIRRLVGKRHQQELAGTAAKQPLPKLLVPELYARQRVNEDPRLTDAQKTEVLWVRYRLRLVMLHEHARLRYLSGKPTRS